MSDEFTLDLEQQGSLKRASIKVIKKAQPIREIIADPTVQAVSANSADTCSVRRRVNDSKIYLMRSVTFSGFNKGDKATINYEYQDSSIGTRLDPDGLQTELCLSRMKAYSNNTIVEEPKVTIAKDNIIGFNIEEIIDSEGNKCTFRLIDKTKEYSL